MTYQNGNAQITIEPNGTRTIEYNGELKLEFPLNVDIRVSSACSFGYNPKTKKAFCDFCHESATTNGKECNYQSLQNILRDLPRGIELAIGCNHYTVELWMFLEWCKIQGYICNLTINQGHILRDLHNIMWSIPAQLYSGLGISYRSELKWNVPQFILDYEHTVFHVIAGIDTFSDVEKLADKGVKKILVLGEKDFGFNVGKVDLTNRNHKEWFWWVSKLFKKFEVVSFDNLALEQLKIKRFFSDENWNTFNQGEESFYINAVEQYFAPSSRSSDKTNWTSIKEYYDRRNQTNVTFSS